MAALSSVPRVVVVTRSTDYENLLMQHATRSQAIFFLKSRGQSLEKIETQHLKAKEVLRVTMSIIPSSWRRAYVERESLDRFLFEPSDYIVVVGQDGLVANVAKYLDEQLVFGVNPNSDCFDGILVPLSIEWLPDLFDLAVKKMCQVQKRTIVKAEMDDGQVLMALNELFVGHRGHQSARYRISTKNKEENQSSSGVIISTGTGCTGWASSISEGRVRKLKLPEPEDNKLVFFVREAFSSVSTSSALVQGVISRGEELEIRSEMNNGGVVFGDGIESDYIPFDWGKKLKVSVSYKKLNLVSGV